MASAKDVATYFLQLDTDNTLFSNDEFITRNGRSFVQSSGRLNKYLHLAQNIYFAKTSELLFPEKLYAFDNGGVVEEIRTKFFHIRQQKQNVVVNLSDEIKVFLKKLYIILKNADIDELIKLSHQDPEWIRKNRYFAKKDQIMETEKHLQEYKEQYADVLQLMESMAV